MNRKITANTVFVILSLINVFVAWKFQDLYFACLFLQFPLIVLWGWMYGMFAKEKEKEQ